MAQETKKHFHCKDVGYDCEWHLEGDSEDQMLPIIERARQRRPQPHLLQGGSRHPRPRSHPQKRLTNPSPTIPRPKPQAFTLCCHSVAKRRKLHLLSLQPRRKGSQNREPPPPTRKAHPTGSDHESSAQPHVPPALRHPSQTQPPDPPHPLPADLHPPSAFQPPPSPSPQAQTPPRRPSVSIPKASSSPPHLPRHHSRSHTPPAADSK